MHHHHHRHHHGCDSEAEGYSFMGRFRGGHGRFGGGFMGGEGFGGQGFRTGRKLGSGELQLLVLALLAEKPCHGYEIIKALEERSGGFYAPSPGMVYPALTYLEEIGHATVQPDGAKKLYSITEEGRAHLEKNRATADAILEQLARIGSRMDTVRRAFSGETPADDVDADRPGFSFRGYKEAWLARRELKAALHDKKHSSPEEYQRIAEILRRAAEEIRKK
jgi:DNA-binding PadR family transcriptional regulator